MAATLGKAGAVHEERNACKAVLLLMQTLQARCLRTALVLRLCNHKAANPHQKPPPRPSVWPPATGR